MCKYICIYIERERENKYIYIYIYIVLELLAGEDEALLVRRDALLVLDLGLRCTTAASRDRAEETTFIGWSNNNFSNLHFKSSLEIDKTLHASKKRGI